MRHVNALLDDIIAFRDECLAAKQNLLPCADPTGDARLAYSVVADQLTALITRHADIVALLDRAESTLTEVIANE